MKFLIPALLSLSLSSLARAEPIVVPGSAVSFEPPSGFTVLTNEEIAAKYPAGGRPARAVGNDSRTATVAFELVTFPFTDEQLPEAMEGASAAIQGGDPSLRWVDRKLVDLQGQRWIYLEMTSSKAGEDSHGIMLVTPHAGKGILFDFSSSKDDFSKLEQPLRASMNSIRIGQAKPAP